MSILDFLTGSKENDDFYKTTPGTSGMSFEGKNNSNVEYYRQKAKENGPYRMPGSNNSKKPNAPKKNLTRANRVSLMGGPQPAQASKGSNSLPNIVNFKGGKRTRKQRKTRKH